MQHKQKHVRGKTIYNFIIIIIIIIIQSLAASESGSFLPCCNSFVQQSLQRSSLVPNFLAPTNDSSQWVTYPANK
jgi:hypothetical protein